MIKKWLHFFTALLIAQTVGRHIMKQTLKDIILVLILIIIGIELIIYYSDLNLVTNRILEIGFSTMLVTLIFIFIYYKKWSYRILISLTVFLFGISLIGLEIIGILGGSEKINKNWNIGEYEIIYANMEFFAGPPGPGSEPYFKLRKKYLLDQFYRTLDKQKTEYELSDLRHGKKICYLKFENTGIEFDLCEKKRLK